MPCRIRSCTAGKPKEWISEPQRHTSLSAWAAVTAFSPPSRSLNASPPSPCSGIAAPLGNESMLLCCPPAIITAAEPRDGCQDMQKRHALQPSIGRAREHVELARRKRMWLVCQRCMCAGWRTCRTAWLSASSARAATAARIMPAALFAWDATAPQAAAPSAACTPSARSSVGEHCV